MGTLAAVLAGKKIPTPERLFRADVEGDIESVNNVLKITTIRVTMHLTCPEDRIADAEEAFKEYLTYCPAAQSVKDCITLEDELIFET